MVRKHQCQDSSPSFVETPFCDPCSPKQVPGIPILSTPGPAPFLPAATHHPQTPAFLRPSLMSRSCIHPPDQQWNLARPKADWSQRAQFQDRPKQALHHRPVDKASVCPAEKGRCLRSVWRTCHRTALRSCTHGQSQWLLCVTTGNSVSPAELMSP